MLIGEKIYKLRKMNGLSQEELASKLNVSRQAVSKWETGVTPDMDNVLKLAKFFDCSLDYLVNDDFDETVIVEKEVNTSGNNKLPVRTILKFITVLPVLIIAILYVLSYFIDLPINIKEYDSGYYYVGFANFIEHYNLRDLVYLLSLITIVGLIALAIVDAYVLPKKKSYFLTRKNIFKILLFYLLLILGFIGLISVILNSWKVSWNFTSFSLVMIYCLATIFLYINLRMEND